MNMWTRFSWRGAVSDHVGSIPPLLIHLTRTLNDLASILDRGKIEARKSFGALHDHSTLAAAQKVVCLSALGLQDVEKLATGRKTSWGFGLHRSWAASQGAAPVWYLPRDTPVQQKIFRLVKQLAYERDPEPDHPLWGLTPFIDYPREGSNYDWRWEQEWRVHGDLHFDPQADVAVLFAPEADHDAVREMWMWEVLGWPRGPVPPLVDPVWDLTSKIASLRAGIQDYDSTDVDLTGPDDHDERDFFSSGQVAWVEEDQLVRREQAHEWAHWLRTFDRDDV